MANKLSLLAAAALVAGGIGYALAQAPSPSPSGASNQDKCWDPVSKQIKDKTAMKKEGAGPPSSAARPGAATSGAGTAGSGAAGPKPGSPAAGADRDRPPQAAGLPNC
jgi:hypothetical protein